MCVEEAPGQGLHERQASPERGGTPQLATAQIPTAPASTTPASAPAGGATSEADSTAAREQASSSTTASNKIDPAQMTTILSETNKMLKA